MRESFRPFLEKAIREATAGGGVITLALIDVDHFKRFNDKFGHDYGDEILKYAASTLRLTMDENQTYFFRYGGDEFIIAFVGKTAKEAYQLLKACRHNILRRPFLLRNRFQRITLSIGIASYPHDSDTVEDLVVKADNAMYYSKRHGRDRITLWRKVSGLKTRKVFTTAGLTVIIVLMAVIAVRMPFVKHKLAPVLGSMKALKLAPVVKFDKIVLKNGTVLEGSIVGEDEKMVMLQLNLKQGEGSLRIEKSNIAQIRRVSGR